MKKQGLVKMNKQRMTISCKGSALIIAMFFVILFSSFSVAMFIMSSNNMRIADNHQDAGHGGDNAGHPQIMAVIAIRNEVSPVDVDDPDGGDGVDARIERGHGRCACRRDDQP